MFTFINLFKSSPEKKLKKLEETSKKAALKEKKEKEKADAKEAQVYREYIDNTKKSWDDHQARTQAQYSMYQPSFFEPLIRMPAEGGKTGKGKKKYKLRSALEDGAKKRSSKEFKREKTVDCSTRRSSKSQLAKTNVNVRIHFNGEKYVYLV